MERSVKDWGGIVVAFVVVIVVNGMANGIPLGGQNTGEISAKYPSLFTPAGFTFSIWGLIYTLLLAFVIWQALPGQRNNKKIASISTLFIANCAANAAWIFAWHYDLLWLSLLLMGCILLTLVQIYRALEAAGPAASIVEWFLLHLPFSIYTGWITVATIANISCVQVAMGWDSAGLSQLDWTLLKLAIAGAIGATVIIRKGDIAYVLVIAWAAYGIASKQTGMPEIVGAATVLAALAVLLAAASVVRRRGAD
jgi:benzodiazapine receptor